MVTFRLASPAIPARITPPDAENLNPNSTSSRSGRAAFPARSIVRAVDRATSTIVSCARSNTSSTWREERGTLPDEESSPGNGTASASISISPTLTGIKRLPATTTTPNKPAPNG